MQHASLLTSLQAAKQSLNRRVITAAAASLERPPTAALCASLLLVLAKDKERKVRQGAATCGHSSCARVYRISSSISDEAARVSLQRLSSSITPESLGFLDRQSPWMHEFHPAKTGFVRATQAGVQLGGEIPMGAPAHSLHG